MNIATDTNYTQKIMYKQYKELGRGNYHCMPYTFLLVQILHFILKINKKLNLLAKLKNPTI